MSKLSEMHSDGSILRTNNAKFGINLYNKKNNEEIKNQDISNLSSRINSAIFNMNDFNRKMALNKLINGMSFI
jgi:hypothetical protein